jgi:hypothetical protein
MLAIFTSRTVLDGNIHKPREGNFGDTPNPARGCPPLGLAWRNIYTTLAVFSNTDYQKTASKID